MAAFGITAARARLEEIATKLRAAASGEVVARAAAKIQEQVTAVSQRILTKHVLSGRALGEGTATRLGSLIQLTAPQYITYALGAEWPFRSGMPPFVVTRALKIFEAELVAATGGQPSPLALADVAASEATAAKFKKDIAKIYRSTPEGKAKRSAERKANRKHDKGVKAKEDRG